MTSSLITAILIAVTPAVAQNGYVCNAYGRNARGQWQTVTGETKPNPTQAKNSALSECSHRGLTGCQPSGCWPN